MRGLMQLREILEAREPLRHYETNWIGGIAGVGWQQILAEGGGVNGRRIAVIKPDSNIEVLVVGKYNPDKTAAVAKYQSHVVIWPREGPLSVLQQPVYEVALSGCRVVGVKGEERRALLSAYAAQQRNGGAELQWGSAPMGW